MRSLNFRRDFREMISLKRKTTTIRLGWKDYSPGEIVEITYDDGHSGGYAVIRYVRHIKLTDLKDEDAAMDGFQSKEELISVLREIYGDIDMNSGVTQIFFDLISQPSMD